MTRNYVTFDEINAESGNRYELDQSITGYYRLAYKNNNGTYTLVHDDPASNDVYDIESAKALFACMIQEVEREWQMKIEGSMPFEAEDLMGALVEAGSDPALIECEEAAEMWLEDINRCRLEEIEADDEARAKLDLQDSETRHIYRFMAGGNAATICFAKDWD